MSHTLPIRIRLTLLFGGLLFIALVLSGTAVVRLLRERLTTRLEQTVDLRLQGLEAFVVKETAAESFRTVPKELAEFASTQPDGQLIEVWDENGTPLLVGEAVREPAIVRERTFTVHGRRVRARAAASTQSIDESVQEVTVLLAWSSPLLLLLIGLTGYWISRGALQPVDDMTQAVRLIGAGNLSGRLPVPRARDELSRLAVEWNESLQRLEESFNRLHRFTEDAAHEFRTPLSVLRASVELALRREREPEEYRQSLTSVLKIVDRMNQLTESLLSAVRAPIDAPKPNPPKLDFAAIVLGLGAEMRPLFSDKGVALTFDVPPAPLYLRGDADSLRRLVAALLDNALKYTQAGGTVTVRLAESGDAASLTVADTGCGIPAESLPKVFDRFYRVDGSRDRATGGYGLGLAIAQQIVESHQGRITAESTPGQGSSFRVLLPSGER